jgi:hypothetical protein
LSGEFLYAVRRWRRMINHGGGDSSMKAPMLRVVSQSLRTECLLKNIDEGKELIILLMSSFKDYNCLYNGNNRVLLNKLNLR